MKAVLVSLLLRLRVTQKTLQLTASFLSSFFSPVSKRTDKKVFCDFQQLLFQACVTSTDFSMHCIY